MVTYSQRQLTINAVLQVGSFKRTMNLGLSGPLVSPFPSIDGQRLLLHVEFNGTATVVAEVAPSLVPN